MSDVVVQILEGGELVESKPLPPDEYIVLCGERKYVAAVQDYPTKGTTVVTIKRAAEATERKNDEN